MAKKHWLVKQEPEDYSWDDLVRDGQTAWTGVRNFQARKHLRAMVKGDQVLFYHSGDEKRVVGVSEVVREPYSDPTSDPGEGEWSSVDISPRKRLKEPVTLSTIKQDPQLQSVALVRQPRLSVMPLSAEEFKRIVALGHGLASPHNSNKKAVR